MKNYTEWFTGINEEQVYNPSIDGPPLEPTSIAGAENQIRKLAREVRDRFGRDPRWQMYQQTIMKASDLLDQAADILDDGSMTGSMRTSNQPGTNQTNPMM